MRGQKRERRQDRIGEREEKEGGRKRKRKEEKRVPQRLTLKPKLTLELFRVYIIVH